MTTANRFASSSRRKYIFLCIGGLVVCIGGLAVCIGFRSKEPTYHGHRARYWIRKLGEAHTRHATFLSPAPETKEPTQALSAIGPAAVPVCMEVLREGGGLFRTPDEVGAVVALGMYGPDSQAAVPLLVQVLDKGGSIGHLAAVSLGKIGPAARAAIPGLGKQLEDAQDWIKLPTEKTSSSKDRHRTDNVTKWGSHLNAALALAKIDPGSGLALHTLRQALKAENWEVRRIATLYLGEIGPDAKPIVPDLLEVMQKEKEHGGVKHETARALQQIDPDTAAAELQRLKHEGLR